MTLTGDLPVITPSVLVASLGHFGRSEWKQDGDTWLLLCTCHGTALYRLSVVA